MTAQETFQKIAKQIPFIRGVTVSGGECTLYPEFLTELFSICREHGLETMLDSNGTMDFGWRPNKPSCLRAWVSMLFFFAKNANFCIIKKNQI